MDLNTDAASARPEGDVSADSVSSYLDRAEAWPIGVEMPKRLVDVMDGYLETQFMRLHSPLLYEESLDELLTGGEKFDPVVDGFAFRGLKTVVVGLSKAGKSYTTWSLLAPLILKGLRVKYLTEEPREVVADKLRTFCLMDAYGDEFRITRRPKVEYPWHEIAARLAEETKALKLDVVVIDTMRPWLKLNADDSNKSEVMGAAIDALSPVCERGAAVIVLHQAPWDSLRARGSTEIHAAADLVFGITGEGYGPRSLKYLGGRVEGIEESRVLRWTGDHNEDLGRMRGDRARRVGAVLDALDESEEPMTLEQLEEVTGYSVRSLKRWLPDLEKKVLVVREPGEPQKGQGRTPDRWRRPGEKEMFARMFAEMEEELSPEKLSLSGKLARSEELSCVGAIS